MQDQRSTQDQIDYLAVILDDQEEPELAAWVRGEKPKPSIEGLIVASKTAIRAGLYDADDWVRHQFPEEE
jgi:hypothetical protein